MSTDAPASSSTGPTPGPSRGLGGDQAKVTRVVSSKITLGQRVRNIWDSRELLRNLISTEIKVKYKGSILGLMWSMVSPAMTLMIFWFVFGVVLRNGIPNFVIFLFSGMLFWNFFQLGVQTATGIIVARSGIVKKVAFPREILALACVGTAGVFFFFQTIVLIIFMVALGAMPDWPMVPLLFVSLFAVALMSSALGIALSAVNVYLRDMSHLIEVILTAWFWACPIVYSYAHSIAPHLHNAAIKILYLMNPMTPVVMTSQRVIYAHPVVHLTTNGAAEQILPSWSSATYIAMNFGLVAFGLVLMVIALTIFGRLEGNFAEEL